MVKIESVISELRSICGNQHVVIDPAALARYSMTTEPHSKICGGVVYPGSVEEIRAILKLANSHAIPVWTFSCGNNWGYGTKNALLSGSLILILSRMNRILEVNKELAYAVVEPGVTQQQLSDYLSTHHPDLMPDCTDSTPLGSVLGNAVERGYGYTNYGDHFANLCGLEVVLPNGELLRTGGVGKECPTWHTHKWGSGPYIEGLFSQSNLGIVVKAGVWLCPRPEQLVLFILNLEDTEKVQLATDHFRKLSLDGTLQCHVHIVNAFQSMSLVMRYPEDKLKNELKLDAGYLSQIKKKFGISEWTAIGGIYGTSRQVQAKRIDLANVLGRLGRLDFFDHAKVARATHLYDAATTSSRRVRSLAARFILSRITNKDALFIGLLKEMFGVLQGQPTWSVLQSAYFKNKSQCRTHELDPARDNCGIMWLAPAIPMTATHVRKIICLVEPQFSHFNFNMAACLTMMNERSMFLLLGIFFNKDSPDEKARAAQLYEVLCKVISENGYQHYRSGIPAWESGSIQSPESQFFLKTLKQAIDPNGILSPGRYQIPNGGENQ